MKDSYKAALLAVLGLAVVSSADADTVNDLYLGFTSSTASSDIILDLGQASTLVGQTSVVDLSSDYTAVASAFSTDFGSAPGVSMSVVGGNPAFNNATVYLTQLRTGGAGTPAVAGSSLSQVDTSTVLSGGGNLLSGLGTLPAAGGNTVDSSKSWTGLMNPTAPAEWPSKIGVNPVSAIDGTGIIYEDLYYMTKTGDTYEGYFTFDPAAPSQQLTFTSTVVPEPSTYGLLATAGLLVFGFRNKFRRQQA